MPETAPPRGISGDRDSPVGSPCRRISLLARRNVWRRRHLDVGHEQAFDSRARLPLEPGERREPSSGVSRDPAGRPPAPANGTRAEILGIEARRSFGQPRHIGASARSRAPAGAARKRSTSRSLGLLGPAAESRLEREDDGRERQTDLAARRPSASSRSEALPAARRAPLPEHDRRQAPRVLGAGSTNGASGTAPVDAAEEAAL